MKWHLLCGDIFSSLYRLFLDFFCVHVRAHVYACVCVRVSGCVCVCVCGLLISRVVFLEGCDSNRSTMYRAFFCIKKNNLSINVSFCAQTFMS